MISYDKTTRKYTDANGNDVTLTASDKDKKSARARARRQAQTTPTTASSQPQATRVPTVNGQPIATTNHTIPTALRSERYGDAFFSDEVYLYCSDRYLRHLENRRGTFTVTTRTRKADYTTQQYFAYAEALLKHLARKYNVAHFGVRFTNHRATHYRYTYNTAATIRRKRGELTFGAEAFNQLATRGYWDYRTVEPMIRSTDATILGSKGIKAIHYIVLHEFAHLLQGSQELRQEAPHGWLFHSIFRNLILENSYEAYNA